MIKRPRRSRQRDGASLIGLRFATLQADIESIGNSPETLESGFETSRLKPHS